MSEGGDRKRSRSTRRGDWEARWHTAILEAYKDVTEDSLSNPEKRHRLPIPTLDANRKVFPDTAFDALGRKNFKKLLKFTMEPWEVADASKIRQGKASWEEGVADLGMFRDRRAYVIGTPGEGKSYLLAMLAGFLHSQGEWVVVYLSAAELSYKVLRSSLKVALARDSAALSEMQTILDTQLLEWLESRPRMVFLVDDYNELDLQREMHDVSSGAQFWKEKLHELFPPHTVVFCCSCRSSVRRQLVRSPHDPCLILAGGFSEEEMKAFEATFMRGKALDGAVSYRTGVNPRLLKLYIQGPAELDAELAQLEESLEKFIQDLSASDRDEFVAQLAGAAVGESLPRAMDARCFYTGESGKLEAICDELKAVALSICVQQAKNLERSKLEKHIRSYTKVLSPSNMVRTGWNVEEATLLTLGGFPVSISLIGKTWNFQAEFIETFSGGIAGVAEVLEGRGRHILHVPSRFNCEAVDCVMEGKVGNKTVVAGVQISVNKDPQHSHQGAIAEFCRVVRDARATFDHVVFIWVGHFPENLPPKPVNVEQQNVVEVTMTFGKVHSGLACIDDICADTEGSVGER